MFNPNAMISPWDSVVKEIDSKDPVYRLLIDRYNIKVNSVSSQDKRTNTIATCEQVNSVTNKPYTRQIEYDRLDIGQWAVNNTEVYTDKFGIKRRTLLSGSVNSSSINVDIPTLATTLYENHNILVSEADLTYGEDKSFTPVNTDYGKAYYLLNCTTYGDVVTYTSGKTIVNHLNVGRETPLRDDSAILPSFSITRDQINNETLQIKLPKLSTIDDWGIMFESVNNLVDKSSGVFWVKVELSNDSKQWNVVSVDGQAGAFAAGFVNTITVTRNDNSITLTGTNLNDVVETITVEIMLPVDDYLLQRITSYSRNPYATTFQFEMTSDSSLIDEQPPEINPDIDPELQPVTTFNSVFDSPLMSPTTPSSSNTVVDLIKNNTISAHPKSNALTGRIDLPITLSDLTSVNYKEYAQNTYRASSAVKYKMGTIDRVSTIDSEKLIKGEFKITGLPELIRTGKFNKITFRGHSKLNNGYDHGVWSFEVMSVNLEANTMKVVIRERNKDALILESHPIPTVDTFKYEVCSDYMRFDLGANAWWVSDYYGDNGVGIGTSIKQQNVAVSLYLNTEMVLPEVTYTKTITNYQRG